MNVPHAHQINTDQINTGVTKTYGEAVSIASNSQSEQQPNDYPHLNELLKPTNGESMSTAFEKKKSLNLIYKAVTDINVEFCSVKKSSVIAIGFPNSDSKKLAEDKIKND